MFQGILIVNRSQGSLRIVIVIIILFTQIISSILFATIWIFVGSSPKRPDTESNSVLSVFYLRMLLRVTITPSSRITNILFRIRDNEEIFYRKEAFYSREGDVSSFLPVSVGCISISAFHIFVVSLHHAEGADRALHVFRLYKCYSKIFAGFSLCY